MRSGKVVHTNRACGQKSYFKAFVARRCNFDGRRSENDPNCPIISVEIELRLNLSQTPRILYINHVEANMFRTSGVGSFFEMTSLTQLFRAASDWKYKAFPIQLKRKTQGLLKAIKRRACEASTYDVPIKNLCPIIRITRTLLNAFTEASFTHPHAIALRA